MVHKLEGMFSILIYDQIKNTCYFFRDRFGIKPLYYLILNKNSFFFGNKTSSKLYKKN